MDHRIPSRSGYCSSHFARVLRSSQLSTHVQGQLPRDRHAGQQYRCGPRSSWPPSCQIAKGLDIFHGAVSCKSSVTADSVPAGVHRQVRRGRSSGRITFRPVVYRADMLLRLCGALSATNGTYGPDFANECLALHHEQARGPAGRMRTDSANSSNGVHRSGSTISGRKSRGTA
jgi:hypothetical protein